MAQLNANIPEFQAPFLMPGTGNINPVWYQFLLKLFARTGGPIGSDSGNNEIIITAALALLGSGATPPPFEQSIVSDAVALSLNGVQPWQKLPAQQVPIDVPAHGMQTDPLHHALATTSDPGFMAPGDKTNIANLQSQVAALIAVLPPLAPVNIVSSVVGANSTADFPAITLSIPANTFIAGSMVRGQMGCDISALAGASLNIYAAVNSTKYSIATITAPSALGGSGLNYTFLATQRAANVMLFTLTIQTLAGGTTPNPVVYNATATFTVSSANTITLGFNWSAASPSNSFTVYNAFLKQEK